MIDGRLKKKWSATGAHILVPSFLAMPRCDDPLLWGLLGLLVVHVLWTPSRRSVEGYPTDGSDAEPTATRYVLLVDAQGKVRRYPVDALLARIDHTRDVLVERTQDVFKEAESTILTGFHH